MDITKLKQRLTQLTKKKKDVVWRPTPGKYTIRIVPSKFSPDTPFTELKFHYNVKGKTYLSPDTFGRPDPIVEFANDLKSAGNKDDWQLGNKMAPKLRIFAPVLIRGEESSGVKYWSFGWNMYQELMNTIVDPDFGDITDLKTGRDILVEVKSAEETGKSFATTTIRVKPNISPAISQELRGKLDEMPNIMDQFEEKSYEDLKKIMEDWMKPADAPADEPSAGANTQTDSPSANAAATNVTNVNADDAFEKLFGEKK